MLGVCLLFVGIVPMLQIVEGVITAWIPGVMILLGAW